MSSPSDVKPVQKAKPNLPQQAVEIDRIERLARELFVQAVNAGKSSSSELSFLAAKAFEQAAAFFTIADEKRL